MEPPNLLLVEYLSTGPPDEFGRRRLHSNAFYDQQGGSRC